VSAVAVYFKRGQYSAAEQRDKKFPAAKIWLLVFDGQPAHVRTPKE
jgi:hypothetical protein